MSGTEARIPVAVLGATGVVGESLITLLDGHPWFRLAEVAASERSVGGTTAGLRLSSCEGPFASPLVLSALPANVASEVEPRLALAGHLVVSNASTFRDDPDVPLVVPEVNPDHLALLDRQSERWPGGIVTNPNCSVAGLVVALKPLEDSFGLEAVTVTTLQALSGAGRPGPAALDLVDNVLPFIAGEEDKVASEPKKILGRLTETGVAEADFAASATCTRVPVRHGHLESVSVRFRSEPSLADVETALRDFTSPVGELPTAPAHPLVVLDDENRPQPRLDRDLGAGMTVSVGRLRPCEVHHVSFLVLSHNLIRGAAGAAILNAELATAEGRVPHL